MSRYLKHFVISAIILTLGMVSFIWKIDPYGIYHNVDLTDPKPVRIMNERVFKSIQLTHTPADVIFLGTSRMDMGMGREQDVFVGKTVLNLSTFGQPIRETRRLMELAVEGSKPKIVVIGLDFFAFNALLIPPSDLVADNYHLIRKYNLLLSISALSDAWKVYKRDLALSGDCCYRDGFLAPIDLNGLRGEYRKRFLQSERSYLLEKYTPYPQCDYVYSTDKVNNTIEDMRAMLRLAHEHKIDLRFFVSPSHARQWEVLAIVGLWDKWEDWKRQLVRLNHEEATKAGVVPFPFWDLSGYNKITMEPVPAKDDQTTVMKNYTDTAHYTVGLGQYIMKRMYGLINDDWGRILVSDNIEAHLAQIRQDRIAYRKTHPQDIAEIEKAAIDVERVKQCHRSSN